MSRENLETVGKAWDAWLRGDLDSLFATYFDPDAVYDLTHFREWRDQTYRGLDGVRRGLTEWLEVWEAREARVDDVVAAPDGRVVVLTWQRGKAVGVACRRTWSGRRSSLSTAARSPGSMPMTTSKALEAAGLSE
jgi:ketosteroid isomerase-like protein